jgi:3-isopropylmalate dehydrogenase
MTDRTLLILPGDGIGPEVMAEVRKVIDWFGTQGIAFDVTEDLVGGAAYDAHGTPLTDATMEKAQRSTPSCLAPLAGRNTTCSTSP